MDYESKILRLKEELQRPLPGLEAQELMAGRVLPMPDEVPANAKLSAVLSLLFANNGELNLVLIQRTEDKTAHSGQIGLPGGRQEPYDEDLAATALRETQEEIGVESESIELLGALTSLYIPVSNFRVFPFVGYADRRPDFNLNKDEVASVLEVRLDDLFHHSRKTQTTVRPSSRPDMTLRVPSYTLSDGTIIWGATAMMLSELEVVWNKIVN